MSDGEWIDLGRIQSVLCLGAHSDDIEIGCGGTILRLLAANPQCQVTWVVFSGDAARRDEAQRSAMQFLAGTPHATIDLHQFADRFFPTEIKAIKEAFFNIRQACRPQLVFTHRLEDRHQDHRCLAECTWNTFREQTILEYEIPKYEGDLGQPNLFVQLSREVCARKVELLLQHFGSQRDKYWFEPETFWSLLRLRGLEGRSPSGYAEAFTARKLAF